jgi:hypothetical protein
MNRGPRGSKGPSPFMNAHPERDIDSTPAAIPTPISPSAIELEMLIAAVNEEAQKRLTV